MEQEGPTFNTTFWVEGDGLNPDEFTGVIGIQPTETTRKGELSPHPAARAKGWKSPTTSWSMNFERPSDRMDEEVQKILDVIWEKRDHILDYVRDKSDVKVGVTSTPHIYEDGVEPVYDLSVDTIQKLAYIGCDLGMDDVYDYRPPLPLPPHLEGWSDDSPFLTTSVWVGGDGFDLAEWRACVKELAGEPLDNGKGNPVDFPPDQGEFPAGPAWNLTRTSRYYSTDEAIREVLAPIWAKREAIQEYLTKRAGVMGNVRCRVEIVEDRTVYELLPATLQHLAFFGWAVRMDVLNYKQEEEDE